MKPSLTQISMVTLRTTNHKDVHRRENYEFVAESYLDVLYKMIELVPMKQEELKQIYNGLNKFKDLVEQKILNGS